jgi:hypothetical protein
MVRNYRTIYEQEEGVDAVAIATTSSFTGDAEELAEDLDMYTLDMDDILHQLASIDIDSFTTILSPFDLNEYDFVDIPHSSDKGGCPQCNTSGSLWEGELEDKQNIMRCEDCGATWKSGADGSWSQIS